ncbi:hypothetical protein HPB47_013750 [Ixodes persulcatus]|uniref:Uncharacterized protein n=1 Tax=Ixodes persulcatus TaxID=34615 RepID=A0AC60R0G1_IXOPE|nr:hypothetical protein HPB47_013750 [Ixodes persulcatus]
MTHSVYRSERSVLPELTSLEVCSSGRAADRAQDNWVLQGELSLHAHQILDTHQPREGKRTICIIWTPPHTETEVRDNARAHHLAREEADARAMVSGDEHKDQQPNPPTPLTTYKNITTYYREQRRTLPPPHHTLDKGEQVKWRLLQTNT